MHKPSTGASLQLCHQAISAHVQNFFLWSQNSKTKILDETGAQNWRIDYCWSASEQRRRQRGGGVRTLRSEWPSVAAASGAAGPRSTLSCCWATLTGSCRGPVACARPAVGCWVACAYGRVGEFITSGGRELVGCRDGAWYRFANCRPSTAAAPSEITMERRVFGSAYLKRDMSTRLLMPVSSNPRRKENSSMESYHNDPSKPQRFHIPLNGKAQLYCDSSSQIAPKLCDWHRRRISCSRFTYIWRKKIMT